MRVVLVSDDSLKKAKVSFFGNNGFLPSQIVRLENYYVLLCAQASLQQQYQTEKFILW